MLASIAAIVILLIREFLIAFFEISKCIFTLVYEFSKNKEVKKY